jgi:acyl carrier protein
MSNADAIEQFIVEEVAAGRGFDSIGRDEDLLAQEILDSQGTLELVAFLEERFGIEVGDEDLVPENFKTVNAIAAFADRKGG